MPITIDATDTKKKVLAVMLVEKAAFNHLCGSLSSIWHNDIGI